MLSALLFLAAAAVGTTAAQDCPADNESNVTYTKADNGECYRVLHAFYGVGSVVDRGSVIHNYWAKMVYYRPPIHKTGGG